MQLIYKESLELFDRKTEKEIQLLSRLEQDDETDRQRPSNLPKTKNQRESQTADQKKKRPNDQRNANKKVMLFEIPEVVSEV